MNLRRLFATILALPSGLAASGCGCPPDQSRGASQSLTNPAAAADAIARAGACQTLCERAALLDFPEEAEAGAVGFVSCGPAPDLSALECQLRVDGLLETASLDLASIRMDDVDASTWDAIEAAVSDTCEPQCAALPEYDEMRDAGFRDSEIDIACEAKLGATASEYTLSCSFRSDCAAGRRPRALAAVARHSPAEDNPGAWWAAMAVLESAAVHAFAELARELEAFDAPPHLVAGARVAITDELRHARLCRHMARRHGSSVAPVPPPSPRARQPDLAEFARLNATEGCVRETFAALEAVDQAARATTPEARAILTVIAADETRHAELSWAIDEWVRTRLDSRYVAVLHRARRRAVTELHHAIAAADRPAQPSIGRAPTSRRLALLERFAAAAA